MYRSGAIDSAFGATKNIWRNPDINFKLKTSASNEVAPEKDWFIAGGSSGGSAVAVASGACFG
jgi:aspartyl-tRNA(Asn)/glutamyl-tRNA(Gln) amidotransferase subunit A